MYLRCGVAGFLLAVEAAGRSGIERRGRGTQDTARGTSHTGRRTRDANRTVRGTRDMGQPHDMSSAVGLSVHLIIYLNPNRERTGLFKHDEQSRRSKGCI